MLRALGLVLTVVVIAGIVYTLVGPSETKKAPGAKADRSGEVSGFTGEVRSGSGRTAAVEDTAKRKTSCPDKRDGGMRVGSFERPGGVPKYEILQKKRNEVKGTCGAHLLIDTRARSEKDLTLITRDVKARYKDFDAVSIEFTDTTGALLYNGGAVIFNTTDGAIYIGYVYGAPNNKGYITRAAD